MEKSLNHKTKIERPKMKLLYEFNLEKTDPEITLELPENEIGEIFLSIANREIRNRTDLYQQKHIAGTQFTGERSQEIANLNISIEKHFEKNLGIADVFHSKKRYLVIGAGDCSANLFRSSYDLTLTRGKPLFYLKDEPYKEKEYYAFIITGKNGTVKGKIEKITFRDEKPAIGNQEIPGLLWLFCSTPLVYKGHLVDKIEMACNDYDLRHFFGKNNENGTLNGIYTKLNEGYPQFVKAIEKKQDKIQITGTDVEWYHAGIGIKDNTFIIIHNIGSIFDLAKKFQEQGVSDAVLLDSGGSSVIWANWNYSGYLAHHWYFRPNRGAVIVFNLKGERKLLNGL